MALTLRTNGVGAGLINSNWWNDYYNLLTGSMSDQPLLVNNGLTLKQVSYTTPSAPSLALHAGTGPGIGAYTYAVGYAMGNGLTVPGTTATITTTTGNQQVTLTTIPTGPTGTTARILYRSKVGTSSPLYILHTISDNTTATYLDSASDTSLTVLALLHDAFGGNLQITNQAGVVKGQIFNDGAVSFDGGDISSNGAGVLSAVQLTFDYPNPVGSESPGSLLIQGAGSGANPTLDIINSTSGAIKLINGSTTNFFVDNGGCNSIPAHYFNNGVRVLSGTTSLDNGAITTSGTGDILSSGRFGVSSAGDVVNGSGGDTVVNARGSGPNIIHFTNNGTALMSIGNQFVQSNSLFGVKNASFVKLMEVRANGNMIISGTQYQTASGSVSTASGQSFDSFDVAEVYPTDQNYPGGTIVCPGPNGLLIQCTHDNCFCAMVVSQNPGLLLGTPEENQLSIALAGRVNVKTAFDILARTMVVSDGRGGVRAAAHGESAFVLGVSINETSGAQVGIILKSYFGVVV